MLIATRVELNKILPRKKPFQGCFANNVFQTVMRNTVPPFMFRLLIGLSLFQMQRK